MNQKLPTLLYHTCVILCRVIMFPARFRAIGAPASPLHPCILAGNHISHFDPPSVAWIWPGVVDFMAMSELFSRKWSAWLFRNVFTIPVDRHGTGSRALREAIERIRAGRTVGVFPEGGLRSGHQSVLHPGVPCPPGAAMLAVKTGAPIYPFIILGTDQLYGWRNWFRRLEVRVEVLAPIFPHMQGKPKSRQEINDELDAALKQAYQKWQAGSDYRAELEPRSAAERWEGKAVSAKPSS